MLGLDPSGWQDSVIFVTLSQLFVTHKINTRVLCTVFFPAAFSFAKLVDSDTSLNLHTLHTRLS